MGVAVLALGLALGAGAAAFLAWRTRQPFWLETGAGSRGRTKPGAEDFVTSVAFDPSGKWLAATSLEVEVVLWSVDERTRVALEDRKSGGRTFSAVAFTGSGELVLARASADVTVRRVPGLSVVRSLALDPSFFFQSIAASGDRVAIGEIERSSAVKLRRTASPRGGHYGQQSQVELRNARAERSPEQPGHLGAPVRSVAFARGGKSLVVATDDGNIAFLDPASGSEVAAITSRNLSLVAASRDDAVAGAVRGTLEVAVALATGEVRRSFVLAPPGRAPESGSVSGHVDALAFSPDGARLAVAATVEAAGPPKKLSWLEVWDMDRGVRTRSVSLPTESPAVAFSPSGELLAVACGARVLVLRP